MIAVVAGLRLDVHGGVAEFGGGLPDQPDQSGIEPHHAEAPALGDLNFALAAPRAIGQRGFDVGDHAFEFFYVRVAQVAEQRRPFGDDAGQVRPQIEASGGGLALGMGIAPADVVDGDRHVRGCNRRVAPQRHGGRADMRRLAGDLDAHAARRETTGDDADLDAGGIQLRALLDVQFEVGVNFSSANGGSARIIDTFQFVAEASAILVGAVVRPVDRHLAREGQRAHHRRIEPCAFLVGPVDDLDRSFGFQPQIVERAQNFKAAQHTEDAVKTPAGRLRIQVTADEHRR